MLRNVCMGLYRLLFPAGFLFFVPGMLIKLKVRPGYKATFAQRFGLFSRPCREELARHPGAVWLHAVSVGETVLALSLLEKWHRMAPEQRFVLSTTTTTAQELARKKKNDVTDVIFCPLDFQGALRRTFDLLKPALLVIFETEIWPGMLAMAKKRGIPAALVNARMSDHSVKGYRRARFFFGPLLEEFAVIGAQSEGDAKRFLSISPRANVQTTGNLKFDQTVPENLVPAPVRDYFGEGEHLILLGASTHPGEEAVILQSFRELQSLFPSLRLVLVPRHAERGQEIEELLKKSGCTYARRSRERSSAPVECLLADTTGEMMQFFQAADVVIMGKSLAGQDEGHNLIEPALLNKPIVTGSVLKNFRFVLNALREADALRTVERDEELTGVLRELLEDPALRRELGLRAGDAIRHHAGAADRTLALLSALLKK